MPEASLTDDQRRSHFSELGHRGVESRRRHREAVKRIVIETRRQQGLPDTVEDNAVLEQLAALLENGGGDAAA